jgi:hypothetical protein
VVVELDELDVVVELDELDVVVELVPVEATDDSEDELVSDVHATNGTTANTLNNKSFLFFIGLKCAPFLKPCTYIALRLKNVNKYSIQSLIDHCKHNSTMRRTELASRRTPPKII